jgi:hypothetical protein
MFRRYPHELKGSLDDLGGLLQRPCAFGERQRVGDLQVDDDVEPGGLIDMDAGWPGTPRDFIHAQGGVLESTGDIATGGHGTTRAGALASIRGEFGGRFPGLVDRTPFTVFGAPGDGEMPDGFGATHPRPLGRQLSQTGRARLVLSWPEAEQPPRRRPIGHADR